MSENNGAHGSPDGTWPLSCLKNDFESEFRIRIEFLFAYLYTYVQVYKYERAYKNRVGGLDHD